MADKSGRTITIEQISSATRRPGRQTDTLIGLGLAALLVIWLVFSVVKRIFGLLLLAALAVAGFVLWNNPALLGTVLEAGQSLWPAN